jgi:hypothetical protein
MKNNYKGSRMDATSSMILGIVKNQYPPILRRDEDGDIVRRFSDEDMSNEGLRYHKVIVDHLNNPHYKTKQERNQLKDLKANHSQFGKKLNSDKEKKVIINQIEGLIGSPKYRTRMNATFKVVGYTK